MTIQGDLGIIDSRIELKDKRQISYIECGDPKGVPFFYFHGFPGSRLEACMIHEPAATLGIRLISPDRPGYGGSTCKKNRSLKDWPNDVIELADRLGIQKFSIIGVSGGAPYACACARYIPERILSLGLMCGMGPANHRWQRKNMQPVARKFLSMASLSPKMTDWLLGSIARKWLKKKPSVAMRLLAFKSPMVDQAAVKEKSSREIMIDSLKEAFAQGGAGPVQDLVLYASDWGFQVKEIQRKVYLWHGEIDTTVPVDFARRYHSDLPDSELRTFPEEGHFSLPMKRYPEFLKMMKDSISAF